MGQTISKVTNRVIGTTSNNNAVKGLTKTAPPHIPSIPGKGGTGVVVDPTTTIVIDPITGFTRGTSPFTPSEERQREFLQNRDDDFRKTIQQNVERTHNRTVKQKNQQNQSVTTTVASTVLQPQQGSSNNNNSTTNEIQMPEDLLKFITDMGPVVRNQPPSSHHNKNGPPPKLLAETLIQQRAPQSRTTSRRILSEERSSNEARNAIVPTTTTTTIDESVSVNEPVRMKPGHDTTRLVSNMPLATNIPGYETQRTTSFSTKLDVIDPNDLGFTMTQFYGLLATATAAVPSSSSSPTASTSTNTNDMPPSNTSTLKSTATATSTSITTTLPNNNIVEVNPQQQLRNIQLVQQAYKYIQIPVLLKDTDGSYIGTHPDLVTSLLGAHRGMKRVDTTQQARLTIHDLYEREVIKDSSDSNSNSSISNQQPPQQQLTATAVKSDEQRIAETMQMLTKRQ
jgi:hypothetical protein